MVVRGNAQAALRPGQMFSSLATGRTIYWFTLPQSGVCPGLFSLLCTRSDLVRVSPRLLPGSSRDGRLPGFLRIQHRDPGDLTGYGIPAVQRTGVSSPGSGAGLPHPVSAPARHPDHSGRSLQLVRSRRPGPRWRLSITTLALPQGMTGGTVWPSRGGT